MDLLRNCYLPARANFHRGDGLKVALLCSHAVVLYNGT
jgi:hypothetical protein